MKPIHFLSLCLAILLVAGLSNCKKENNNTSVNNPQIVTKPAIVYVDGGVTLNGQINTVPENLTEYGFLLSTDSIFTTSQRIKINARATTGPFTVNVPTGLQKNRKYFVTAYSIINNSLGLTTYNTVYFNSTGSKQPIVNSILPLKADIGDTITIKGKYFSGLFSMMFGSLFADVNVLSDSVMTCIVPTSIAQIAPVITIQSNGIIDTVTNKFSLNTPIISNFTTIATFRDTITINGDHFGYQNSLNQVSFGVIPATVISSNRKQLKVIVPDNIQHSFSNISIKAQLQTVVTSSQFQIKPPVITSVTPTSGNTKENTFTL